jgi:hypothetical protein
MQYKKLTTVIALILCQISFGQNYQNVLKGIITDIDNEPIPYVNIWIKSKVNIGTSSNLQGEFSFPIKEVQDLDTLVFSSIGYLNKNFLLSEISNQDNLHIILEKNLNIIDEIVINAKKTTIPELMKNFNNQRKESKPDKPYNQEIFIREFNKMNNEYYSLLEAVLNISVNDLKQTGMDVLYLNRKIREDPYNCDRYRYWPYLDLMLFCDYPGISKLKKFKYSIDTILPYNDNQFIYVLSENYKGITLAEKVISVEKNGNVIYEGNDEDDEDEIETVELKSTTNNKYFITNDFKIKKIIREDYIENDNKQNLVNYYKKRLAYIYEIDYEEINNKMYVSKMKSTWISEHFDKNKNFCMIKTAITEYYTLEVKQEISDDISIPDDNKLNEIDLYRLDTIGTNSSYENYIIYDELRKIVLKNIKEN